MMEMEMKLNNIIKLALEKLSSQEAQDLENNILKPILLKLRQLLQLLESLPDLFIKKLDEFLPPETRSETLHRWADVGLVVVLPVFLILLCLYCCCCRGRCGARAAGRMMKAPGRRGVLMPRASFVANPKGYFRGLRGKKSASSSE